MHMYQTYQYSLVSLSTLPAELEGEQVEQAVHSLIMEAVNCL